MSWGFEFWVCVCASVCVHSLSQEFRPQGSEEARTTKRAEKKREELRRKGDKEKSCEEKS